MGLGENPRGRLDRAVTGFRSWHIPLAAAVVLHVGLCCAAWFFPPYLNSDSATGFLVWDSMEHGGPWNRIVDPSPADIARDQEEFVAWWSPGQYLVVGPWEGLGLSLGRAIPVGCLVAALVGMAGYWRLFLGFGFSRALSAWSILAIETNWTSVRPYGDYVGGEVALLAALPWLILGMRAAMRHPMGSWIAVPFLYWLGTMAKLAFAPVGAGIIAGLRLPEIWSRRRRPAALASELLRCAAWLALGHLLLWSTFLRHGPNPSTSAGRGIHPVWWDAALQLAGLPVSSAFSWGNMVDRLFLYPGAPRVASAINLWPVHAAIAIAGIALVIALLRREFSERPDYACLIAGVLAAMEAFYALSVALNLDTDLNDRMFKPLGLLLVPGIIAWIVGRRRAWTARWAAAAGAASLLYGVASPLNRLHTIALLDNVGRQGITQHVISRPALDYLHALDERAPPGSVAYLPSPEIALDVRRLRAIATHAVQKDASLLARVRYQGRAPELIVLVDQKMIDQGRAQAVLDSFVAYDPRGWHAKVIGDWHFLSPSANTLP